MLPNYHSCAAFLGNTITRYDKFRQVLLYCNCVTFWIHLVTTFAQSAQSGKKYSGFCSHNIFTNLLQNICLSTYPHAFPHLFYKIPLQTLRLDTYSHGYPHEFLKNPGNYTQKPHLHNIKICKFFALHHIV